MAADEEKVAKKGRKALVKAEKARLKRLQKAAPPTGGTPSALQHADPASPDGRFVPDSASGRPGADDEHRSWFRDPKWIHAIAAIASVLLAMLGLLLSHFW